MYLWKFGKSIRILHPEKCGRKATWYTMPCRACPLTCTAYFTTRRKSSLRGCRPTLPPRRAREWYGFANTPRAEGCAFRPIPTILKSPRSIKCSNLIRTCRFRVRAGLRSWTKRTLRRPFWRVKCARKRQTPKVSPPPACCLATKCGSTPCIFPSTTR